MRQPSQHLNLPNTSLAACCPLSSSLPRGERTGWLLGLRVLQGKQIVQAAFCFSDDLKSTVVNPSCFSNRLQPQNLLQSTPSPVGEGWGEGIPRMVATFLNTPTAQNTSLAACCPLSSSLPRGERTGWLLGLRFAVMEANCAGCFLFFRRPTSTAVNPSCFSNCQKPQNPLHPALPPWGRAGERAFPEFRQPSPTP